MTDEEIADFSRRLTFMPGWSIEVRRKSFYMEGPTVPDSVDPTSTIELRWGGPCQTQVNSPRGVIREALTALCASALHEVLEFFRLDEDTVCDPHDLVVEDILDDAAATLARNLVAKLDPVILDSRTPRAVHPTPKENGHDLQ